MATLAARNKFPGTEFGIEAAGHFRSIAVEYDLLIVRTRGGRDRPITNYVESIDWSDNTDGSGGGMTGDLSARRTSPLDPDSLPIQQGDRISVLYRDAFSHSPWKEEVQLQVDSPNVDPGSGQVSFTLDSPFVAFANVEQEFVYRKDKHHKNGWRLDQIIKNACEQCDAPYGHIAKGHVVFPSPFKGDPIGGTDQKAGKKKAPRSPLLAFILKCVAHEKAETGRDLVLSLRNGAIEVLDRGSSGRGIVIDPSAQDFQVSTQANVRPPTVISAKGRVGKGKHATHAHVVITAPLAVERFGRLIKEVDFGKVDSHADLTMRAKRVLAKGLRVLRTAQVTIQGTPGLQPSDPVLLAPKGGGDAGHFSSKDFGVIDGSVGALIGERARGNGIAFIATRSHSISAGVWTTQLDLRENDPWAKYRKQLAERKTGYRARKHKSPKPKSDSKKSPAAGH